MTIRVDLRDFIQAHRPHGRAEWTASDPTPQGYRLKVACPCGVTFERWVLAQDAEEDLLRSGLLAFEN